MRKTLIIIGVTAAAGLAAAIPSHAQAPAQPPFNPSFGDLMNMLVQSRHAKLGIAGREQNWPLAAYAVHELKDALEKIAHLKPRFRNYSVADMMASTVDAPITAIEQATKAQDANGFAAAYARLTDGCNSCHVALNHPFVVIKAPDQSSFPNQEFRAAK